jgi:beta-lactamase class A
LRVLFNATYLDRDYSEKLLQLLSESDFSSGIKSGIPQNITVSQKFGDARIPDAQGTVVGAELQNCGIVYYPDHPYQLCIMTKGSDIPDLERIIGQISQIIYTGVKQKYN